MRWHPDRQDHASGRDDVPGDQTEHAFDNGNAAFARNWPYQYGIGAEPSRRSTASSASRCFRTARRAVRRHRRRLAARRLEVLEVQGAANEFVRYMSSPAVEKFDAITNSNVPTMVSVAKNKAVVKANPYLKPAIATLTPCDRPAKFLGTHYNEASKVFYQGINQILTGTSASQVLPQIQSRLQQLLK